MHFRVIPVWRTASRPVQERQLTDALTGLRHEDHAHRYLRAIPAWRGGLVAGLRHEDHAHRYLSGIPAWRRGSSDRSSPRPPHPQVPQCHLRVAKGVNWPVFGTGTMPTGTSGASRRGKRWAPGRSSARPAVSIFRERGDTLRPARTSAYSAPGNTSHRSGARHIQWAPAYSVSARRFSRARRGRGMSPRHIQWPPAYSSNALDQSRS